MDDHEEARLLVRKKLEDLQQKGVQPIGYDEKFGDTMIKAYLEAGGGDSGWRTADRTKKAELKWMEKGDSIEDSEVDLDSEDNPVGSAMVDAWNKAWDEGASGEMAWKNVDSARRRIQKQVDSGEWKRKQEANLRPIPPLPPTLAKMNDVANEMTQKYLEYGGGEVGWRIADGIKRRYERQLQQNSI